MTFSEKNATCKKGIQPQLLPLWIGDGTTEEAVRQHSYRVYLQISDWKCFGTVLDPLDWEWYLGDDAEFHPVANLKAPAPDDILLQMQINVKKPVRYKFVFLSQKWFSMCERLWGMPWCKLQ